MNHNQVMEERRAHNDAFRASLSPGSKFSGPCAEIFFEGWTLVGWKPEVAHYWRRRPDDQLLALCGLRKPIERTFKGQPMIFEIGNYPKCSKCARKRRAGPFGGVAP